MSRNTNGSISLFLSTPSARRATTESGRNHLKNQFLSTPSARRATSGRTCRVQEIEISIHALREEGDRCAPQSRARCRSYFYPRPPRGGRQLNQYASSEADAFLSTPSARRATLLHGGKTTVRAYFYPRPPRGGRPGPESVNGKNCGISIHALREEGDSPWAIRPARNPYFYPRPPRGGRQQKQRQNLYFQTNYTTFCTNLEEP